MNLVEIRDCELLGVDGKLTLLSLTIEDVFYIFYNKILQNIGFKMLETNIFVFLFYSCEIHVMQRDFQTLTLFVIWSPA